jgi:hypothetical protein
MKLALTTASLQVAGHLGPTCIACGNTRRFWIHTSEGDRLVEVSQVVDEEVQITACGRCQSRNSIVVAPVD